MANLNEVLTLIAAQLQADPAALISYADEDHLGGYHIDESQRAFPMGSLWGVEGQILYALVRWLKPDVVVEIGGWAGASASHLALACQKNGVGRVYSVDDHSGGQVVHGSALAPELAPFVTLVSAKGQDWLAEQKDGSIGLLFEDADHSTELVAELAKLALQKVKPGGLLVNHDAHHDFAYVGGGAKINSDVGRAIRDGLVQAGLYFKPYLAEPSDCGVAITVIPAAIYDIHSDKIIDGNSETGYLVTPETNENPADVLSTLGHDLEHELNTMIMGQRITHEESINDVVPESPKKRGRKPKAAK